MQELTQIDAVIFDLDGTLVHTLGDFQVALHRTMADLDLPPVSDALIEQTIGKGSEHLIRTLLAHQIAQPEVKGVGQACPALSVTTWRSTGSSPMFTLAFWRRLKTWRLRACPWPA
jgi:phosphoglycolate phosphatase